LRQEIAASRANPVAPARPLAAPANSAAAAQDLILELGLAASKGDLAALDKLAELAATALAARTNQSDWVLGDVKRAFDLLGAEAGKGNDLAFQSLWRATRMKHLAIRALGDAAGAGNEKALEPLLDPERYLLLRSSTLGALKPAADNGNARAIAAIAAIADDPKATALWHTAANGLENAALSGNATAIDALAKIAKSENAGVRKEALLALENAAFKKHARAAEALRGLGYQ
jgi:hypothetical protein